MALFEYHEERTPACQAVMVRFDTINDIANYFSEMHQFETTLTKRDGYVRLQVHCEANEHNQALSLDMTLDSSIGNLYDDRMYLVLSQYVDPMTPRFTLVPAVEFEKQWRRVDPSAFTPKRN